MWYNSRVMHRSLYQINSKIVETKLKFIMLIVLDINRIFTFKQKMFNIFDIYVLYSASSVCK